MDKYSFMVAALFFSPASLAVFTSFELPDDIHFTGSVISPAPAWKWRTHSTAAQWATNWRINRDKGVKQNDGTTRFSYDEVDIRRNAFLQGVMTRPSSSSRTDIVPVVSFLVDGGSALDLNGNTVEQTSVVIPATGLTRSGVVVYGKLIFTVESAYAVFYKKPEDTSTYYSESYVGNIGWAANSVLIENKPADYTEGRIPSWRRLNPNEDVTAVLRGTAQSDAYDVLGAFTSHLSHFQGVWTDIPYVWTATLTANVRLQ